MKSILSANLDEVNADIGSGALVCRLC